VIAELQSLSVVAYLQAEKAEDTVLFLALIL
jgi:hypothetical protein